MTEPLVSETKIVVGVDGSDDSKVALRWAARQAELTGAPLLAVMSWHVPAMSYGAAIPALNGYDFVSGAEQVLADAVREVAEAHPSVTVSTSVVEGYPAPALLGAASEAALLVVGSRGHGSFTGMLLGSVSEHCVTHALCPVVVVRSPPVSSSLSKPARSD
jgi:nucleotide-binding universal stress UspA family protein